MNDKIWRNNVGDKNKIYILFSGIESLRGDRAIELVERFNLIKYGGVKLKAKVLFYGYFDPKIDKENSIDSMTQLTGLFIWLGLNQIKFRLDRSYLLDSQIDFQLHMIQDNDYITIPKAVYHKG